MRFYGLSYVETLALPVKTFWLMFRNIGRIAATEDQRALDVAVSATSGEAYKATADRLKTIAGEIFRQAPVYEREKIQELMRKLGAA